MTTSPDRLVVPVAPWRARPRSIYGGDGLLPARLAYLRPGAEASLAGIAEQLVASDAYRDMQACIRAWKSWLASKKKAQPARPGESAHFFGCAIDLDVAKTLKSLGLPSKRELDGLLGIRGWRVYRPTGPESWHYTFAGEPGGPLAFAGIQAQLDSYFPDRVWHPGPRSDQVARMQRLLAVAGHDPGAADGLVGPRTRRALDHFRRQWSVADNASAGRVWRVLLAVTAEVKIEDADSGVVA